MSSRKQLSAEGFVHDCHSLSSSTVSKLLKFRMIAVSGLIRCVVACRCGKPPQRPEHRKRVALSICAWLGCPVVAE